VNGNPDPHAKLLLVSEIATILRVSKMTVYQPIHSGELEPIRVGRSFRVPEYALHALFPDAFARE
jgi:excisionase family DNA binding protein